MNQRSVHLHVIADAATSVLAIMALVSGMYLGAAWLDPVVGWVGAGLVAVWAWGLIRDSGQVLLDAQMDAPIVEEIREAIEESGIPVRIGDPEIFRSALAVHDEIVRVTIEVGEIGVG